MWVGRGIRTSEAGAAFATDARDILAQVDRAVAGVQAAARGGAGHMAIGFPETSAFADLIPAVVGAFRRRHPGVTLELQPLASDELRLALRERRIAVALVFGLVDPDPALRSEMLFTESIRLAVPRAHPLAQRRRVVLRDLDGQPFVWSARPERAPFRDTLWALLRSNAVVPRVVIESRSTVTRLSLVASGVGLTFVAGSPRRTTQVVFRPVADLKIQARAYLAWRHEDEASPLVRSLREITRDCVPEPNRQRRRPHDRHRDHD